MLDYSFFKETGFSDNKSLIKFFSIFLESVPKYLSQLETALELGDIKTFREIIHKVKPSLLYLRNAQTDELMQYIKESHSIENIRNYFPLLQQHLTLILNQVNKEKERLQNEQ